MMTVPTATTCKTDRENGGNMQDTDFMQRASRRRRKYKPKNRRRVVPTATHSTEGG